jgi:hypothetical protein
MRKTKCKLTLSQLVLVVPAQQGKNQVQHKTTNNIRGEFKLTRKEEQENQTSNAGNKHNMIESDKALPWQTKAHTQLIKKRM